MSLSSKFLESTKVKNLVTKSLISLSGTICFKMDLISSLLPKAVLLEANDNN